MKYVLLAYVDEKQWDAMSDSQRDALANDEVLHESGHVLAVLGLQSSCAATTVRVHNGKLSVGDGPFSAAREQLIRIFIITARDLNEAILVASMMPLARAGPIEVRPLLEFNGSDQSLWGGNCSS